MGLGKLGKAIDKVHRGHRKIGIGLATGNTAKIKEGVKQAHAGHKAEFKAVATTARQDTASLIKRHPELGLDPGLRAIAEGTAPAPTPGLLFLQSIINAQSGAQGGSSQG